jgi:hypothetical protein
MLHFLFSLIFLFVSCAPHKSKFSEKKINIPIGERIYLGTIGIVQGNNVPDVKFPIPAQGWQQGLMRGAKIGVTQGFYFSRDICRPGQFQGGCDPISCFLAIIAICAGSVITFTTVGGILGAMGGAVIADPVDKVKEAEATNLKILAAQDLYRNLGKHLLNLSITKSLYPLVLLREDEKFSISENGIREVMDYRGLDHLLKIEVQNLGYTLQERSVNPDLQLFVELSVILFQRDGTALESRKFEYFGGSHRFTEWTSQNGQPLQEELKKGYEVLSEQILNQMISSPNKTY